MTGPEPVPCAEHPDVLTTLRCGKCGKPICPKCMVTTPVGARCRECARLYVLPTYRVSAVYYLRAVIAALVAAIAIGAAWSFLRSYLGWYGPIISVAVGYGAGVAVSSAVAWATNHKRGTGLAAIGAVAVLVGFLMVELVYFSRFGHFLSSSYPYIMTVVGAVFGSVIAFLRLR